MTDVLEDRPDDVQLVRVESAGAVLRIVLDRPRKGNAINLPLARQLAAAVEDLSPDVRCILILGAGPNFCVGGDVGEFARAVDPGASIGALADAFHRFVLGLAQAPVPVVVAVHGWVAGAGIGVTAAADVVVATESTQFRPAYGSIGLSPDGGTSWALPRLMGAARALDLLLTDGVLTAPEARHVGLVSRIADDCVGEAERLAALLAEGPTRAFGRTKRLVRDGSGRDLVSHLTEEALAISESGSDPEGREGVRAFIERRTPRFHDQGPEKGNP